MKKINCALIGSGNIGTDLMVKALRSEWLNPVWMIGVDPASDGLARARAAGLKTTSDGLDAALPHFAADDIRIAFDATSAYVHAENARKTRAAGVFMIDLTPAAIGPLCVPPVNLPELAARGTANINMMVPAATPSPLDPKSRPWTVDARLAQVNNCRPPEPSLPVNTSR